MFSFFDSLCSSDPASGPEFPDATTAAAGAGPRREREQHQAVNLRLHQRAHRPARGAARLPGEHLQGELQRTTSAYFRLFKLIGLDGSAWDQHYKTFFLLSETAI